MPNYFVSGGEEDRVWKVETLQDGCYEVTAPSGKTYQVDAFAPDAGRLHLMLGNDSWDLDVREDKSHTYHVQWRGQTFEHHVLNERQKRMEAATGGKRDVGPELLSPMAGKVVAVQVEAGQAVTEGQVLLIVEAMKMENDLKAHKSGIISELKAVQGEAVEVGDVLLTIADE